ncbi:acetyltransferase [Calothrix sp. NIES-4071]|nr:acetyltransferase [Calothrix sp. NIES-4071]BAZ55673.1 acetyltransferase [Calothrix sp. NIES-4105]
MQATITKLDRSQVNQAVSVLEQAFSTDPIFQYLLPQHHTLDALNCLLRVALGYSHSYDHTYISTTTTGDLQGVASWIPPQGSGGSVTRVLQAGALMLPFKLGISKFARVLSWSWAIEELHKRTIQKPHWYLSFLGVAPTSQGCGIGGVLIEPILKQASCDGLPCYLETSTEKAVRFYQKHGFKVVWGDSLLKGAPYLWAMVRE